MTTANLGMTLPTVGADSDTWGDELNTALGVVDTFAGKLMGAAEVTVASAATCDIGAAASTAVAISGTTTITSFGTAANTIRFVRFTGTSLVLTYNGTSLITPTAANIQTAAGDTCVVKSDNSGNWRVMSYTPAGAPQESTVGPTSISSATSLTSLTVGPGKWRISGNIFYNGSGGNSYCNIGIGGNTNSFTGTINGKSFSSFTVDGTNGRGGGSLGPFEVTYSTSSNQFFLVGAMSTTADTVYGFLRAERII